MYVMTLSLCLRWRIGVFRFQNIAIIGMNATLTIVPWTKIVIRIGWY